MRVAGAVLLAAVLLGCAARPVHLYEGPARADHDLAILEVREPAVVRSVNGRPVGRMDSKFALLPGRHEVVFRASRELREFGYRSSSAARGSTEINLALDCVLVADLPPGAHYEVVSWVVRGDPGASPRDWILSVQRMGLAVAVNDAHTGERVMGHLGCDDGRDEPRRLQVQRIFR